jgi:hypothetical protein
MEQFQQLAGLAVGHLWEDDGSGPPPAVPGHVADRLASLAPRGAARRAEAVPGRRRRTGTGRRRGAAPATVT